MVACNGDRKKASEILCMPRVALTATLQNCRPLKQVWCKIEKPEPITAVQSYKKPALQVLDAESAADLEKRMDLEFEKLVCGTGEMTSEMMSARALQKAYGSHLGRCMDLMGGSLVDRALKLKKLIDEKEKLIERGTETGDLVQAQVYTAELNGYIEMHNVLIRILDMSNKSAMSRAKIRQMEGGKDSNKPKGKPGFSPKQTINMVEKQSA